jgi:hypothetical protein
LRAQGAIQLFFRQLVDHDEETNTDGTMYAGRP